jgi:glycosyltransferase involved in cell wall biosynthesis
LKKVLVIIPTKDRPQLTLEAVESVLAQTYTNWSCAVIDDGSSPENYNFLRNKLKEIPKIKLLRNASSTGPAQCRNLALKFTKYDYYSFLDSDDLWMSTKLENQIKTLEKSNKDWIHCNEQWLRDNKPVNQKKIHRKQGGFFWKRSLSRCLISPSAVLFKSSFFHSLGGFNNSFKVAEDYELWLRALEKKSIEYINQPLVLKRAGNWEQLSSFVEIDRYRVLALHRAIRRIKVERKKKYKIRLRALQIEVLKKTEVLLKGARKHNNSKLIRYQSWMYLFNKLRT